MSLKQRLGAKERLFGGLLRMPAEPLVEIAGVAGFDYLLIDCEHGPADLIALQQHIVTAEAHGMPVLVRVGREDPNFVLRVLDLGATGIVVPHVESAAEAERAIRSAHYPPRGQRGFATYSRAGRFGAVDAETHRATAAEWTMIVVMIETETGCADADKILATPDVDAVLVGPADLAASFGVGPEAAVVAEARNQVHRVAERAGVQIMSIVPDVQRARAASGELVVYNLAHVLLQTFRSLTEQKTDGRAN